MRHEEIGGYVSTSADGEWVRALTLDGSLQRALEAVTLALERLRLRNALFVLFIGLTPTSVPALDHTATSTPAAKTIGLFLNEPGGIRRLHFI